MGRMLSHVVRGIAAAFVVLPAGLPSAAPAPDESEPPWSDTPVAVYSVEVEPETPTVDVVYEFEFDNLQVDPDGERVSLDKPSRGTLAFQCAPDGCVLVEAWGGIVVPPETVLAAQGGEPIQLPGGYSAGSPPTGSLCTGDYTRGWTTTVFLAADGAEGGIYGQPARETCSDAIEQITYEETVDAYESVITSSALVSGECWFLEEGCFGEPSPDPPPQPDPEPEPEPTETSTPIDTGGPSTSTPITVPISDPEPASSDSSELDTGSDAARSILSTLATPAEAGIAPEQLGWALILALALVLLVAFPTALLNSAVEQASDRFSEWWAGRRTAGRESTGWNRTWPWAAFGVLAAAILSSFVDPEFGLNPGSARLMVSVLLSFVVDVVIGWAVAVWLVRRAVPGATHDYTFKAFTLLVVLAAVVFTRVTHFEPGVLFGMVAGVAFATLGSRADEGRAALVPLVYAYVLAVFAWLGYAGLGGGAASGSSFWRTFVIETLAGIAIAGMASLPIALLPVRGLPGQTIFRWNRLVWGWCYAVGLFSFFVVLMPMPTSWADVSLDLWVWIAIYIAYAIAAVVAWMAVRWRSSVDA